MGIRHSEFGPKLQQLRKIVARDGGIDCVFMGNSTVNNAIDPERFSNVYRGISGRDIKCYNFGIDAIPASVAFGLAGIIVEDFHPDVFVYGLVARDLALSPGDKETILFEDAAWYRYRQGDFNLSGWLFEHSYLYRYRELLFCLILLDYDTVFLAADREIIGSNGFIPLPGQDVDTRYPPAPDDSLFSVRRAFEVLYDYSIQPSQVAGLEKLMQLNGPNLSVVIVEMPTPQTHLVFFENGEKDYNRFLDQVSRLASANAVPFITTTDGQLFPDDAWFDYSHVNAKGAEILSDWLAHRIYEAIELSTR